MLGRPNSSSNWDGLTICTPSICPIPSLPQRLADGRGRGIVVAYGMQSPAQARDRWGQNGAETMNDATTVSVVLRGLRGVDDLQDLERLCGQRRIQRHSKSDSVSGRAVTVASELEPVMTVAEIRSLPVGVGLVLWDEFPVALAYLPGLWEDRPVGNIGAESPAKGAAVYGDRSWRSGSPPRGRRSTGAS